MTQAARQALGELLATRALKPAKIQRLSGGANNLVFRLALGQRDILAKVYFQHPGDKRDRLRTEFKMLSFLWHNGLRCIPKPLYADHLHHIGLYQFIEGRRPRPQEIGWPEVAQLINLLSAMWRLRQQPAAARLPPGSDYSFSIKGFLDNLAGRLRLAKAGLQAAGAPSQVQDFIHDAIGPAWRRTRAFIQQGAQAAGLKLDSRLPVSQRTLNPADHGFHNVLRGRAGRLIFLDFEYAGWDDPAQMICNACWQPAVPIPLALRRRFVETMLKRLAGASGLATRLRLLYPLFGLKWSLIMLNEFLPVAKERRRFAGTRPQARRQEQLRKSRRQLLAVQQYLAAPIFFDGLD